MNTINQVKKQLEIILWFIQHNLSYLAGWLANCRAKWIKNSLIRVFSYFFSVDLSICVKTQVTDYANFNEFFTRRLQVGVRPLVHDPNAVVCPVEGGVSQFGSIRKDLLLQAKNIDYSLLNLLGDDKKLTEIFQDGNFITFYLAPQDYHRVHMPLTAELTKMLYIPGFLFSVKNTQRRELFTRNERVVSVFSRQNQGTMAIIQVGAFLVANIHTQWHGSVNAQRSKKIQHWNYQQPVNFIRGEEMGYFSLGSTVILLFSPRHVQWASALKTGDRVQLGQTIGRLLNSTIS
jgi:phosphatidylserine decarboxylase